MQDRRAGPRAGLKFDDYWAGFGGSTKIQCILAILYFTGIRAHRI